MTAIHPTASSLLMPDSVSSLASCLSNYAYNDFREGRVRALLSASLQYEHTNEKRLIRPIKQLFTKLVEDAYFYGNKLIWVAPPHEATEKPLFTRNLGIYLGLWLIHTYLNRENSIPYILNTICFDVELGEITSVTHRNRIKKLVTEKTSGLSERQFYYLINYYDKCKNRVVLEAIVCLCFKSGLIRTASIFQQVNVRLSEADPASPEFVRALKTSFAHRHPVPSVSLDLCDDVVSALIRNRFNSICQFCGDQFVETVLLNNPAKSELKPTEWLTTLHRRYPNRNILFNQLIRRERMLLKMPAHIFNNQTDGGRFNYHLDFLRACYQTDMETLSTYPVRLDTTKFMYRFDTFCIKLLLTQDFAQLNNPLKMSYFRQYYKNIQLSLLLVKRHEKEIVWQGRSFTDNLEVDFLFFFMNDYRSINDYKAHFATEKLTDADVLEIFFWALELGIIEPLPSPVFHQIAAELTLENRGREGNFYRTLSISERTNCL